MEFKKWYNLTGNFVNILDLFGLQRWLYKSLIFKNFSNLEISYCWGGGKKIAEFKIFGVVHLKIKINFLL